jgi:type I restriction enzyme, S subunit
MDVKPGYKQTEVGVIPEDWNPEYIENVAKITTGAKNTQDRVDNGQYPFFVRSQTIERINSYSFDGEAVLTAGDGVGTGKIFHYINGRFDVHQRVYLISDFDECLNGFYFYLCFSNRFYNRIMQMTAKSSVDSVRREMIAKMLILLPSTLAEQEAIAEALSDTDALIESLEQLIAKKRQIKQGAMQELLTGKRRLPGFQIKPGYKQTEVGVIPEDWEIKTLQEITDCLDNLRVPLNGAQREKMRGNYPYCGANGVLDFVSDYLIDDDIILVAEDGGYFDEYSYRPIAYRIVGKCWVNNHAHILKARFGFDQGFIFYSLVHKNILNFLASGTRAKLNKSEMYKITVLTPSSDEEQKTIAGVLSNMDDEISKLETKLAKTRKLKQGMMQELLTGRIRLI